MNVLDGVDDVGGDGCLADGGDEGEADGGGGSKGEGGGDGDGEVDGGSEGKGDGNGGAGDADGGGNGDAEGGGDGDVEGGGNGGDLGGAGGDAGGGRGGYASLDSTTTADGSMLSLVASVVVRAELVFPTTPLAWSTLSTCCGYSTVAAMPVTVELVTVAPVALVSAAWEAEGSSSLAASVAPTVCTT